MGIETSLARQVTQLLYSQRAEKHPTVWTALRCKDCSDRLRPFQVEAFTYHTRVLLSKTQRYRATVICGFCDTKHQLPYDQQVPADERWTPERPVAELVAATAPSESYQQSPEPDQALLRMFDQIQRDGQRWKGNSRIGWQAWLVGIALALLTAGLIYVTGIDAWWRFEDDSGSPMYFALPLIVAVVGIFVAARRGASASVRDKLAARIKMFGLDESRLRELALNSGSQNAAIVLALDEIGRTTRAR